MRLLPFLDRSRVKASYSCVPVAELLRALDEGRTDVEDKFFAVLRLRNGVFKTTARGRLDNTFATLLPHLQRIEARPLDVLDVACSSGITTLELHRALKQAGIATRTLGTDLVTHAKWVSRDDGCGMLFDSCGRLLQFEIGDFAGSWQWPSRKRHWLVAPVQLARGRWFVTTELETFTAALSRPMPGFRVCPLQLLSREALLEPGITFAEEDILHPPANRSFHFIRAANILNTAYFKPEALRAMVRALFRQLRERGLLFIVKTSGRENRGSIYERVGERLRLLEHVNGGSEISGLIESS